MFLGIYWHRRRETREEAALRIALFLDELRTTSEQFVSWFLTGWTRKDAQKHEFTIDAGEIAKRLKVNRADVSKSPIPELGYSLSLWNGRNTGLNIHVGVDSPPVGNSVTLSVEPDESATTISLSDESDEMWRQLLRRASAIFEADDGLVIGDKLHHLLGKAQRWDLAWLSYRREAGIEEHPERR